MCEGNGSRAQWFSQAIIDKFAPPSFPVKEEGNGHGYALRKGARLGRQCGVIAQIKRDGMVIHEQFRDGAVFVTQEIHVPLDATK